MHHFEFTQQNRIMNSLPKKLQANNRTGVTGVGVDANFYYSYIVDEAGRRISKKFSFTRYGKDEACRLAIKWRRDQELRIHGYTVIPKDIIRKEDRHRQSVRRAKAIKSLKRMAVLKNRRAMVREFEKKKREYQKLAGKFIYRIDDINIGHGWLLRIEVQGEILFDGIFRDRIYGSPEKSLEKAQGERKRQLALRAIPYARGRRFIKVPRSTNSTGVTGVCRTDSHYLSFIPTELNRTKRRKFSIARYGEMTAFRLAIEWRREKEIEVYGDTVLTDERIDQILNR